MNFERKNITPTENLQSEHSIHRVWGFLNDKIALQKRRDT